MNSIRANTSIWFKWLVFVLVGSLVLPAIASSNGSAMTELSDQPYTGLDLVVLVDQSGSMGGRTYGSTDHPTPNDPNNLRFEGAQFLVDWLGSARLAYGKSRDIDFRVALIDFGDTVQTRLDITTIAPESEQEWKAKLAELRQQVSATQFGLRNMGNTNHLRAFQEAKQVFERMNAQEDKGRRLRAIIMLTDGIPYVLSQAGPTVTPAPPGTPTPTATAVRPIPVRQYMPQLVDFATQNFPYPEYQIFVVGMNDSDTDQWGPVRNYWLTITHQNAELTANNEQVGATLQKYLGRIAQEMRLIPEDLIPCGPQDVPPYLKSIRFTIHKARTQDTVTIKINGVDLNLSHSEQVIVDGRESFIESIEVLNPEPGLWDLICQAGKLDPQIYRQQLPVESEILGLQDPRFQHVPAPIQIKFSGARGAPLPQYADPRYRLQVEVGVMHSSSSVTLTLQPDSQGLYAVEFTPPEPGPYSLHLAATTQSAMRKSYRLLDEDVGSFIVSSAHPQLLDAPATTVLTPARVVLQLSDDNGQPIDPRVFTNLGAQLSIALAESTGTRTFPLQSDASGNLTALITPLEAGELALSLTTGANGEDIGQLLNERLGILKVYPMQVTLRGLGDAQAQYKSMNLAVQLSDYRGAPLLSAADQTYSMTVVAALGGVESGSVTLTPGSDSTWSARIQPQNAGDVAVHVTVRTTRPVEKVVFDSDVGAFRVSPTTLVSLAVLSPLNGAEIEYNRFIPFWLNPFEMEVELRTQDQPLDPAQALVDPGRRPFDVQISDSQGRDRTAEIQFEPAGQSGRWRGRSETLTGRDTYRITVQGTAPLKPAFVWNEAPVSLSVARIANRLLPITYGVSALILGAILFMIGGYVNNRFIQVKALGALSIEDSNGRAIGTGCQLTSRGLHSVVWKPNAPQAGVRAIRVKGLKNGVHARVFYAAGAAAEFTLTSGNRRPLKAGYWLVYQGIHRDDRASPW